MYNSIFQKGGHMKLDRDLFIEFRKYKNSLYDDIKVEFLYHSNKLEGSTFTKDAIYDIIEKNTIRGDHTIDDAFETVNSVDLFDKVIDDCGIPLSHSMLFDYHELLKKRTSDDLNGLSGHYKTIMNRIRNSSVQVAFPNEVRPAMEQLINDWNSKTEISIEDIVSFHSRFEHIHPFQDGNGRLGRFIILKQCVENNIDLIAIDDDFSETYKLALEVSQTEGDLKPLTQIFLHCQQRLDDKLKQYNDSIQYLKKEVQSRKL